MTTIKRDLGSVLATHEFSKDLRSEHLALLVGCASNRVYHPGDFLFRQGEPARDFFLLRHGRVAIEVSAPPRGPLTLQTVGAGDVLGWAWIVQPYVHRFDARATGLTRAIALDGSCLRDKFDSDHELGYQMLRRFVVVMVERLESTRLQLLDLYGGTDAAE